MKTTLFLSCIITLTSCGKAGKLPDNLVGLTNSIYAPSGPIVCLNNDEPGSQGSVKPRKVISTCLLLVTTVTPYSIEVLKNDEASTEKDGVTCALKSINGQVFKITKDREFMSVVIDGKDEWFSLQKKEKDLTWTNFATDKSTGVFRNTSIIIRGQEVTMKMDCLYEKKDKTQKVETEVKEEKSENLPTPVPQEKTPTPEAIKTPVPVKVTEKTEKEKQEQAKKEKLESEKKEKEAKKNKEKADRELKEKTEKQKKEKAEKEKEEKLLAEKRLKEEKEKRDKLTKKPTT